LRNSRRLLRWTLIALAVSVFFLWWATPPGPLRVDASGWDDLARRTIAGAYHIHTTRSDGYGDRTQVAAAAARAGLQFIILTDHGDATRPPDLPAYINHVLVLDGVEISSNDGHYVAIDMPRAPYPLGGSGDAVVEDVRRLGGFGIIAHPDSPKSALRWMGTAAPDGVEWLNLDSEWRDETRAQLLRAGIGYLLRQGPALASILDRPSTLDVRWPALLARRRTVALAAADAHGGVGRREEDPGRSLWGSVGIPSYDASFRAFTNRVVLPRPLSGDAALDARAMFAAIRAGNVFSAIDGLAAPALLQFTVEAGSQKGEMGASVPEGSDATLVVRAPVPADSEISLVRDGHTVTSSRGSELRYALTEGKGAYRAEIAVPRAPGQPAVPWIVSNAIYFGEPGGEVRQAASPSAPILGTIAPFPWRIEKDPSSSAMLRTGATDATLEFKLGDGPRRSQFVALATDLQPPLSAIDMSLSGDRPMRVWVQLRATDGARWGRSYYVDPAGSLLHVPVSALAPIGSTSGPVRDATSLLLVIDLTNAQPGRTGVLRVLSSALIR
jgi:hypothetical protein